MGTTLYVNTWPLHAPYSPLYSYHIPFAGRLPYMYVDRTKYTLLTTDSDPVYEDFYQYSYTLAKAMPLLDRSGPSNCQQTFLICLYFTYQLYKVGPCESCGRDPFSPSRTFNGREQYGRVKSSL